MFVYLYPRIGQGRRKSRGMTSRSERNMIDVCGEEHKYDRCVWWRAHAHQSRINIS